MERAAALCDWRPIQLLRPFVHLDKAILPAGLRAGVPFHLTWTCYQGGRLHCGKCGACHERKDAFAKHRLTDPVEYEP